MLPVISLHNFLPEKEEQGGTRCNSVSSQSPLFLHILPESPPLSSRVLHFPPLHRILSRLVALLRVFRHSNVPDIPPEGLGSRHMRDPSSRQSKPHHCSETQLRAVMLGLGTAIYGICGTLPAAVQA
jgi:hypothetical protein